MKHGVILFLSGLLLFMAGISISLHWPIIGTLMGISGGLSMGSAAYFFGINIKKD